MHIEVCNLIPPDTNQPPDVPASKDDNIHLCRPYVLLLPIKSCKISQAMCNVDRLQQGTTKAVASKKTHIEDCEWSEGGGTEARPEDQNHMEWGFLYIRALYYIDKNRSCSRPPFLLDVCPSASVFNRSREQLPFGEDFIRFFGYLRSSRNQIKYRNRSIKANIGK